VSLKSTETTLSPQQGGTEGPTPAVEITALTKSFGKKKALESISLSLDKGCILALIGPNGAGKTTLIKTLLGLLRPSSGTLRVLSEHPSPANKYLLQHVGYLPQEAFLYTWMTVKDTLWFTSRFYRDWDFDYSYRLLQAFGLEEAARIRALSHGMVVKLELVLALSHKCKLLIMDEPMASIDFWSRRDIIEQLIQHHKLWETTIVFSSHIISDVEQIATHVALLDEGRLVLFDRLADLLMHRSTTEPGIAEVSPKESRCSLEDLMSRYRNQLR